MEVWCTLSPLPEEVERTHSAARRGNRGAVLPSVLISIRGLWSRGAGYSNLGGQPSEGRVLLHPASPRLQSVDDQNAESNVAVSVLAARPLSFPLSPGFFPPLS